MSKWCLCWGVSLHKDQLLQDPLTFKQNSSYELFWFFRYIFSFFFTVLVVHHHHDHPVTTVLTHYSPMAWYSLFVPKVPLNTNQPTWLRQNTYTSSGIRGSIYARIYMSLLLLGSTPCESCTPVLHIENIRCQQPTTTKAASGPECCRSSCHRSQKIRAYDACFMRSSLADGSTADHV